VASTFRSLLRLAGWLFACVAGLTAIVSLAVHDSTIQRDWVLSRWPTAVNVVNDLPSRYNRAHLAFDVPATRTSGPLHCEWTGGLVDLTPQNRSEVVCG
jgi:hypothetical protein